MAGPVLDLGLQGGRWQLYRDPPRPPPVGVAIEGNGGDALIYIHTYRCGKIRSSILLESCAK
jgi:hypothetical protein